MIAKISGSGERISTYEVSDNQMAAGSTFGSPKATLVIKATGAIEKLYSVDAGKTLVGSVVLHHFDERSGIPLTAYPGTFIIHPERQEHHFELSSGVQVHEEIFLLSGEPQGDRVDPPAAYYTVTLTNATDTEQVVSTFAAAQLRGDTSHGVATAYSPKHRALLAWNTAHPQWVRVFGCSVKPSSYETTRDIGKPSRASFPGKLSDTTLARADDPLGMFQLRHRMKPGESVSFSFTLSFSVKGRSAALRTYARCPTPARALAATREYYHEVLGRAVVLTPDQEVNRGVLWAKANMLRTQTLADTGWCFVNDPTRSNNSVARDTAWFAFGSDYITPEFSRASLLWYAQHLEKRGMVVEYYDVRNGKTEDYGLNINDNTPLLILALWHHYGASGDGAFLKSVYPFACKAANYILSQRNKAGLVWCTATGTSDYGIVGWRNVITNYTLSGATTEVNSECYAALKTVAQMARVLKREQDRATFQAQAEQLRQAINEHLFDKETGLYYLNIDTDGHACTDVTSDLVFPVMFGVADEPTAAHIISRLSAPEFWSEAGMHTVPRNAINYGPTHGYGLLGGVWIGVTFWYVFAAARFNPEFMAYALAAGFRHYSIDPLRNNTVPGQFSEWLHGESLANQGMMLSPWFPPRYLWAAIEGAAGLDLSHDAPRLEPRLAPDWKWMGVRNLPLVGERATWFVARVPDLTIYTNFAFEGTTRDQLYDEDISPRVRCSDDATVALALRKGQHLTIFVGNTMVRTVTTALCLELPACAKYAVRTYSSVRPEWVESRTHDARDFERGLAVQLDRKGFCVLELRREG